MHDNYSFSKTALYDGEGQSATNLQHFGGVSLSQDHI
jgi:hypothetical protein